MKTKIFVYGTLMKEMPNHYLLKNSKYLGKDEIDGYIMYNLGNYPGIKKGNSKVKGEIYEVTDDVLKRIDILEALGYLYSKEIVNTKYGYAYLYVYIPDIKNKPIIPYNMQPYNELLYYVSYGSNMLKERLLNYIEGTICKYNGREYKGCRIKNKPINSISLTIPYNIYYSKESSSWDYGSVCFLDTNQKGFAYARAYLICKSQYEDIKKQEGLWYRKEIKLNNINGFKAFTFTKENTLNKKEYKTVSEKYKQVLKDGLKESFPELSFKQIDNYLENAGNF